MKSKLPKLYIGCSLNGAPEDFVESVENVKNALRADFEVLDFVGLNYETTAQVYKWDIEHCVRTCDFFVAICDERSTGLGWELCEAVHLGTPILAAAHKDTKVSGIVLGAAELKQNMTFTRYDNLDELPALVKQQFAAQAPA